MAAVRIICAIVVLALVGAPLSEAAVSCATVASSLAPCLTYLEGKVKQVSNECCKGITSLNNNAKSTLDKQTACGCLKNLASSYKAISPSVAEGLPTKCGVTIPYKISASTNCKSVK